MWTNLDGFDYVPLGKSLKLLQCDRVHVLLRLLRGDSLSQVQLLSQVCLYQGRTASCSHFPSCGHEWFTLSCWSILTAELPLWGVFLHLNPVATSDPPMNKTLNPVFTQEKCGWGWNSDFKSCKKSIWDVWTCWEKLWKCTCFVICVSYIIFGNSNDFLHSEILKVGWLWNINENLH